MLYYFCQYKVKLIIDIDRTLLIHQICIGIFTVDTRQISDMLSVKQINSAIQAIERLKILTPFINRRVIK